MQTASLKQFRDLPEGSTSLLIDRTTKWGNPFPINHKDDRADVIEMYHDWIMSSPKAGHLRRALRHGELDGVDYLICHCAPRACHGDVLIELATIIANKGESDD